MFIAAVIIYIVLALVLGATWPFDIFGGRGWLLQIIAAAWWTLLIASFSS